MNKSDEQAGAGAGSGNAASGDVARGPSPNPWGDPGSPVRIHEPALRLAWPAAALALVFLTLYGLLSFQLDPNALIQQFAFVPAALLEGQWYGAVTALFVHGSWSHVIFNAVFTVAFGQPIARRFGLGPLGGALFLLFFLVCGVAANLCYGMVHSGSYVSVVGASGGIAGFYAAASRLMRGPGLAPLNSPTVVVMGVTWVVLNLVIGLLHIDAGFGANGAPVAWETHIAGYFVGLLLIGLFDMAAPGPRLRARKD